MNKSSRNGPDCWWVVFGEWVTPMLKMAKEKEKIDDTEEARQPILGFRVASDLRRVTCPNF